MSINFFFVLILNEFVFVWYLSSTEIQVSLLAGVFYEMLKLK